MLAPLFQPHHHDNVPDFSTFTRPRPTQPENDHPIDFLIYDAGNELDTLLAKEKTNVHDAAQAYRDRRGRQPPPGFNLWFEFAKNNSALVAEDFWDQIYHDLNPFWGLPAKQIREQARDSLHRISVRNGGVSQHTDIEEREWLKQWANMIQTIAQYLPDVDLAINVLDESRIIVPWEDINGYMEKAQTTRRMVPQEELKDTFQSLAELDEHPPDKFDPEYVHQGTYWPMAAVGCPPESQARNMYLETDFMLPPPLTGTYPGHSYKGYVKNWTLARSPCDNAHLQGLHGTFIEPVSLANSKKLFPLFGGSKLPMNNDILLPAAMYWTDDPFYSGGKDHGVKWEKKKDKMIWRGAASGGRNRKENWTRFQRHRFVGMVNATSVHRAETKSDDAPPNFVLPADNSYHLAAQDPDENGTLSSWVKKWSDVAFVHVLCFPRPPPNLLTTCEYTDPWYSVKKMVKMKDQYKYKYLPDIDGNSFSGRYRGFLSSTSLPIKATIYHEWHNSRLVPWKHFVPMDNTFIDIYGIMEYFLGNEDAGVKGHDGLAKDIANGGKAWADMVLRKEDMQIYVFRLLLEYARLCDEDREIMGWCESKT